MARCGPYREGIRICALAVDERPVERGQQSSEVLLQSMAEEAAHSRQRHASGLGARQPLQLMP